MPKTCQYCQKPGVHGNHERFCSKNPNRIQGQKAVKSVAQSTVSAPQELAPIIVTKLEPVPEAQLPNFKSQGPDSKSPGAGTPGAPGIDLPTAIIIRPLIDLCFDGLDKKLNQVDGKSGPPERPAPIPEAERHAISTAYGAVIDKYLPPELLRRFGAEVAAVMLTLVVVLPKVLEYRAYWKYQNKLLEVRKAEAAAEGPAYERASSNGSVNDVKDAYEAALKRQAVTK